MTSREPQRCCEAVRLAILATAWLLVGCLTIHVPLLRRYIATLLRYVSESKNYLFTYLLIGMLSGAYLGSYSSLLRADFLERTIKGITFQSKPIYD